MSEDSLKAPEAFADALQRVCLLLATTFRVNDIEPGLAGAACMRVAVRIAVRNGMPREVWRTQLTQAYDLTVAADKEKEPPSGQGDRN